MRWSLSLLRACVWTSVLLLSACRREPMLRTQAQVSEVRVRGEWYVTLAPRAECPGAALFTPQGDPESAWVLTLDSDGTVSAGPGWFGQSGGFYAARRWGLWESLPSAVGLIRNDGTRLLAAYRNGGWIVRDGAGREYCALDVVWPEDGHGLGYFGLSACR